MIQSGLVPRHVENQYDILWQCSYWDKQLLASVSMTPSEADVLERAYRRDGASAVIKSLLSERSAARENATDQIAEVMCTLEEMAEYQADIACCLMLTLWPIASDLMMHDVCDGIFLWIDNNRGATVIEYLKRLVASENDSGVRRRFEGLLHHIEKA